MAKLSSDGFGGVSDWRGHYNTVRGPEKIEARQQVYWLAHEMAESGQDQDRIDLELEAVIALQHAGLPSDGTIVDIGCSLPNFLQLWKLNNHRGTLIGIEPNIKQIDSMPYWQPAQIVEDGKGFTFKTSETGTSTREGFEGIEVYEAWASALPVPSGSADAATMMLMMYHVPKALQSDALGEAKRILNKESGIFGLTTRANDNKRWLRTQEQAIGDELSKIRGEQIIPPPPVNSGFTSEDAAAVLPDFYKHVYTYDHTAEIRIDNSQAVTIVERAIWSLLDKYVDRSGQPPNEEQFDTAINKVLGKEFLAVCAGRLVLTDLFNESLFIAADRELDLPEKFKAL